jgi:CheY-like chemotaxis protein
MILEDDGYHVAEAANGLEAVQVLRAGWLPNLVFLDKNMPGMGGQEFLDEIEFSPTFTMVPIVVITGDRVNKGTRVYLQKPISMDRVLEIAKVFSR